mmetsp:Transcript_6656/g.21550  ORF Transcript_6656/g.21550 Transcript_6656/m.21550 type:complete len:230 (-) Transcript_6656:13-702(-)
MASLPRTHMLNVRHGRFVYYEVRAGGQVSNRRCVRGVGDVDDAASWLAGTAHVGRPNNGTVGQPHILTLLQLAQLATAGASTSGCGTVERRQAVIFLNDVGEAGDACVRHEHGLHPYATGVSIGLGQRLGRRSTASLPGTPKDTANVVGVAATTASSVHGAGQRCRASVRLVERLVWATLVSYQPQIEDALLVRRDNRGDMSLCTVRGGIPRCRRVQLDNVKGVETTTL